MRNFALLIALMLGFGALNASRQESMLKEWQFCRGEVSASSQWQAVSIPHDWAIYGPFDRKNDLQKVAVEQNMEKEKSVKTGRTGGLPYVGKGTYKTSFQVPDTAGKCVTLVFDGAMSEARVKVNGREVCYWPYGYNSFYCDVTAALHQGLNDLEVGLENVPESSRWYPGAGLYRNVHLITTDRVHIPVWGTYITTPHIERGFATVKIATRVAGMKNGEKLTLATTIYDSRNKPVASDSREYAFYEGVPIIQNLVIGNPALWSPESPSLYRATTQVIVNGGKVDSYETRFGVRKIEIIPDKGFFLNGERRKFKGVCNHHDLGPLGSAVNESALRHQLELLKDMGCDAIRTSHNMPAPELVRLCDEMGFMMMVEPFDDWNFHPKSRNGYSRHFNEWAEKDMMNMIHHYRNNPSVILWSIGNEVPNQWSPTGLDQVNLLQGICHREDPTRPVTCGMDQFNAVVYNGFAAALDVPGFNYKVRRYPEAYSHLPQKIILGSETASTVSSRGNYKFPVKLKADATYADHQSSSYDVEYCGWSNIPDEDFAVDDDLPYNIGQFVWTGFDYLGEPSPYDTDAWPNHSSMFGIIDLASIPKDRYYLYRSVWNRQEPTLHILPHWNWRGREGRVTPIFVYTSYPKAELFINGRSCGMREKNDSSVMNRYRLMWRDTKYEPGIVKVVAYDEHGQKAAEQTMRTAGTPHHIVLTSNRDMLKANGEDLAYITVQVADKDGNIVPTDSRKVTFSVTGAAHFRATANGDPTCLDSFQKPEIPLFAGAATLIVESGKIPGEVQVQVSAKGVKLAKITLQTK